MKRWLWIGMLIGLINCQPSVDVNDPLYHTWQWIEIEQPDGRIVSLSANEVNIVTFQTNGTILYGANGRYNACCLPHRFRRKGNVLDFTNVNGIPVPETDNPERCALVDCLAQGDSWTIRTLTLILETPLGVYTYRQ